MDDKFELIMIGGIALVLAYIYLNGPRRLAYAVDPNLATSVPATKPGKATNLNKAIKVKSAGGGGPWACITHRERLQVLKDPATFEGVVIAAGDGGPHGAPDGDWVMSVKPDPAYASMVNNVNIKSKKYQGGLWVENVCQGPNKASEPRHQGDCKCNAPKLLKPKVGDHLRITGAHVKDVGETGHLEMHPVYTMEKI